jgi:hypothetical protein
MRKYFKSVNVGRYFTTYLGLNKRHVDFLEQFNFRKKSLKDGNYYLASYNRIMKEFSYNDTRIHKESDKKVVIEKLFDKDFKQLLNEVKSFQQSNEIISKYLESLNSQELTTELYLKEESFLFKVVVLYESKDKIIRKILENVLSLLIQQYGENSIETANLYLNLSQYAINSKDLSLGEKYAQKSLDILTNLHGKSDLKLANSKVALANSTKDISQRISLLKEAFDFYNTNTTLDDTQCYYKAICSFELGSIYNYLKDDKNAMKYLESSLLDPTCVPIIQHNITVFNKLGEIYLTNGYVPKCSNAFKNIILYEHKLNTKSNFHHNAAKGLIELIEKYDYKLNDSIANKIVIYLSIIEHCINYDNFRLEKFISITKEFIKTNPEIEKELIAKFYLHETYGYIKLLKFDEAKASIMDYAKLSKDDIFTNFELGRYNIYLNKPNKAVEHFESVLKLLNGKDKHQDLFNICSLLLTYGYLLQGNRKRAIENLKSLSDTDDQKLKSITGELMRFILTQKDK